MALNQNVNVSLYIYTDTCFCFYKKKSIIIYCVGPESYGKWLHKTSEHCDFRKMESAQNVIISCDDMLMHKKQAFDESVFGEDRILIC